MQPNSTTGCVGLSGEFFAAAVLQRKFKAIAFATSNSPFDLICQSYSGQFFTCQVKATASTSTVKNNKYWQWSTSRSNHALYKDGDADFFALVALPLRAILFVKAADIKSRCYRLPEKNLDLEIEAQSLTRILESLHE